MVRSEVRGGALALLLFMTSLLIGNLATGTVITTSPPPGEQPANTATPSTPATSSTPIATRPPTPTSAPTLPSTTPTIQLRGTVILNQDNATAYRFAAGSFTHPLRMVAEGEEVYLLDAGQLKLVSLDAEPSYQPISPPDNRVDGVVMQELADITSAGDDGDLLLLDRAGNVFRYLPDDESWQVERSTTMSGTSSRQHLISVHAYADAFYLLDTNVGQIWQHSAEQIAVIPAETDLSESADFAVGEDVFVLVPQAFRGPLNLEKLSGSPLTRLGSFAPPSDLSDPSLLFLDHQPGGYLYVVDKGYERLRLLDQDSGALVREHLFEEEGLEIRSIDVDGERLFLASRDVIYIYPRVAMPPPIPAPALVPTFTPPSPPPHDPGVLELLPPLRLPIDDTALPDMAFRLPGAPRSYRYGVHEGVDFYLAAGAAVTSDTQVLAVADGEVVRVDREYLPPTVAEMEALLSHTRNVYHTPSDALDVLRGRQIWIDHSNGVVSRYCHLSAVAEDLQVGQQVAQGQIIGYVGNSGTPASYYEQGSETHLHLEIRIGDGYLGQHLRPSEVKRWLSRVFGEDT